MSFVFRHSMCNEGFDKRPFAESCRVLRRAGYTGIEIAPFTLADDPTDIGPSARREYRDVLRSEGLEFVGFHWLMVSSKGLHVTTPDDVLRARSWRHIRHLIDLCADLGPAGVMVFGSPKQRSATGGLTPADATRNFVDGLTAVAPHAASRGVTILVEALPAAQSDVVQSLAEAVAIVRALDSPAIRTMFDVHNAVDETEPHEALVDRYFDLIRHVHVNEFDGRHCGTGSYDFKPVLAVLRRRAYRGWISLEAFDFTPGADRVAAESIEHLQREIDQLPL